MSNLQTIDLPSGSFDISQLTPAKAHLQRFGYAVLRGVFSTSEVNNWSHALGEVLQSTRAGSQEPANLRATPLVQLAPSPFLGLLDDTRLLDIADGLLGENCLFTGSNDGNSYAGATPWHIDGGDPIGGRIVKLSIYCEPVGAGSGGLSVMPGSHHPDYFRSLFAGFYQTRTLDMHQSNMPGSLVLSSNPGDVICFDHRLWHGSWGGQPGRQQFAYSFAEFPSDSWSETWLCGYLHRINQRHGKRMLHADLLEHAEPRRIAKLRKLFDMGL
jgi:hypothetical protein